MIVFVDILGLNEIIESAGVDAALGQLQAYSAMLTRLAAKHQGFVVSSDIATQGSKLVITFGTPVAHEYAPANAARFALDLTAGLRAVGARPPAQDRAERRPRLRRRGRACRSVASTR